MSSRRSPVAEFSDVPDGILLRRLGAEEADRRADRLAEIYQRALGYGAEPAGRWAGNVRTMVHDYAGATVLAAVDVDPVAETDDTGAETDDIIGFLVGFDLDLQHWWPRQVEGALRERGHGDWLEDAFELMDLQVHPSAQGRGVGTALLTRQLADMPHRRMVLSTDPEGRARALYRRLGFVDLVPDFVYAGTDYRAALMGWVRPTV